MEIMLDASRNKEFAEKNKELLEKLQGDEEGSSSVSNRTLQEVYIPPDEKERLLAQFSTTVTQDFDDEFHMSRAEREKMQEQYAKFFKLKKGFTKKIRRLDKYVEACRICMSIIDDIAQTNGIYTEEKFKEKVLNGSIVIEGLNIPKFQGKRKKSINWDYVAEFIVEPTRDLRELTEIKELAEEEIQVNPDTIVTEQELAEYTAPITEKDEELLDYNMSAGVEGDQLAFSIRKKDQKWLFKHCPSMVKTIRNIGKSESDVRHNAYLYDMTDSELKALKTYDAKLAAGSDLVQPTFNGDFTDSKSVDAYLYQLEEYESETSFVEYNGRMISAADAAEMDYLRALESSGWNLRNLYDNRDRDKRIKQAQKDDRKRIDTLRKMLAAAQEASDLREKGYSEKEIKKLSKLKTSEGKKNKKKKKKAKKDINEIILDAVNSDEKDFKVYEKQMKKMKMNGGD